MGPAAIQARTRHPGSIQSTRLSKSASHPARCARLPASSSRDHSDRWTAQPIWAGGRTHVAGGRTIGAFGHTHAAVSWLFVQCVATFVHICNVWLHLCPLVLIVSTGRRTPLARLSPAAAPGGRRWSGWSRSSRIRRTTTSPPGCSTGARRLLLRRRPEPARGVFRPPVALTGRTPGCFSLLQAGPVPPPSPFQAGPRPAGHHGPGRKGDRRESAVIRAV
jgi:hypothetical protein